VASPLRPGMVSVGSGKGFDGGGLALCMMWSGFKRLTIVALLYYKRVTRVDAPEPQQASINKKSNSRYSSDWSLLVNAPCTPYER
jgi:hypothetical protein